MAALPLRYMRPTNVGWVKVIEQNTLLLMNTSFSLMGEKCLVQHAASLFRGLISVLNEQAARSTSLTEKLVS